MENFVEIIHEKNRKFDFLELEKNVDDGVDVYTLKVVLIYNLFGCNYCFRGINQSASPLVKANHNKLPYIVNNPLGSLLLAIIRNSKFAKNSILWQMQMKQKRRHYSSPLTS